MIKKFPLKTLGLLCMITGTSAFAQQKLQDDTKNMEVTKYTVMERFEPGLVLSTEERVELKEAYKAERELRREIIDTLHITERKREKLLNDLAKNPFSARLSRTLTLAEIEFED